MEYINYQTQDQWQGPASQQSPIDIVLEQTTPRPLADQPLTVSFVGDQALSPRPPFVWGPVYRRWHFNAREPPLPLLAPPLPRPQRAPV